MSLSNWQGIGAASLGAHAAATGSALYLHIKKTRVPKPPDEAAAVAAAAAAPASMNELLQASLPENKYDVAEALAVVAVVGDGSGAVAATVPFPHPDLPMGVADAAQAVATHTAAGAADEAAAFVEDEARPESKHAADLPWLESGIKIDPNPSSWKCAESGMTDNLWLNLGTGHIGSGRRNWDGSGGTDGALNHFEATGRKYPLVVKLGTITPEGADVYSYAPDEDRMVTDAKLASHLARWGINIMALEKTAKTMAELELELNKSYVRPNFFALQFFS